ncbi:hypothetical protein [Frateuria sp.]|uniref:hypothetical protein n=1 Tax=Frateuria sp. TaxID=2211372 RepID=UPI003F814D9B
MQTFRHLISCICLVAAPFMLSSPHFPAYWVNVLPPLMGTLLAVLIGRVSLPFVILVLIVTGPIMVFSTLFLMAGIAWPGQAVAHLRADMPFGGFLAVTAQPLVGAATWFVAQRLTNRSSGRAKARAA